MKLAIQLSRHWHCKIVLTWRCFAIGIGETRDVEVGLASSTGETGEARAARSGVAE